MGVSLEFMILRPGCATERRVEGRERRSERGFQTIKDERDLAPLPKHSLLPVHSQNSIIQPSPCCRAFLPL